VTSAFVFPVALLHTTTLGRPGQSLSSLLAASTATSTATQAYLKLGSATAGTGRAYYPISSARPANLAPSSPGGAARIKLSFDTSSPGLLGEVLRAGAAGGRISSVSLALRTPGRDGRPTTELVDTFTTGQLTSFTEHLSGTPTGSVSLVLPVASHLTTAPGTLRRAGPFARAAGPAAPAAKVYVALRGARRTGVPFHPVAGVTLTLAAPHAPLNVGFTTAALPLLAAIFYHEGAAAPIAALTLSVQVGGGSRPARTAFIYTFSRLSVSSFAENLSGSLSGTTTLTARPPGRADGGAAGLDGRRVRRSHR
jgi:hypothetical protein